MAKRYDEVELILQDCLEKIQSGQETLESVLARYPDLTDELRPALEAAFWLRSRKEGLEPRPGYLSASRRRLVDQIKQEQAVAAPSGAGVKLAAFWRTWLQALQSKRVAFQFVTASLLVIAMISGSAGIARASQNSLPGESLFPVKLAIEGAQVLLTPDDAAKAAQHIERAQRRLFEIESLLLEKRDEQIASSVKLFEEQVNTAVQAILQVQNQDEVKAQQLARSLTDSLSEQFVILRLLAPTASPAVAADLELLLLVTGGVIDLVQETVPVGVEPTLVSVTPEPTSTPLLVQVVPSVTPLPTEPVLPSLVSTLALPGVGTPIIDITQTPTATVGIIAEDDDTEITPTPVATEEIKPTKEPKPDKEPKPKKDKKVPPEPTRRPPRPTRP